MEKKKKKPASPGKFKKASQESVSYMEEAVKGIACDSRKMFGYPCYFVNGNMFTGLFADDLFFRVDPEKKEETLRSNPEFKPFEPLPGRTMKEYLSVEKVSGKKMESVKKIIHDSLKYTSSLPLKKKK